MTRAAVIHAAIQNLALPIATSISGDVLIYILCPLIVAAVIAGFAAGAHLSGRLRVLEQGLAIIVQQVSPPGATPLRELVNHQAVETAELRGLVSAALTPTTSVVLNPTPTSTTKE